MSTPKGYRGFESPPLRQIFLTALKDGCREVRGCAWVGLPFAPFLAWGLTSGGPRPAPELLPAVWGFPRFTEGYRPYRGRKPRVVLGGLCLEHDAVARGAPIPAGCNGWSSPRPRVFRTQSIGPAGHRLARFLHKTDCPKPLGPLGARAAGTSPARTPPRTLGTWLRLPARPKAAYARFASGVRTPAWLTGCGPLGEIRPKQMVVGTGFEPV